MMAKPRPRIGGVIVEAAAYSPIAAPVNAGLLAYWPYDSDSVDLVGGVVSPGVASSPSFVTGVRGNALSGQGSAIAFVHSFPAVSVALWIKMTGSSTTDTGTVAVNYASSYLLRIGTTRNTRRLTVGCEGVTNVVDQSTYFVVDTWKHIVAVRDTDYITVYADGAQAFKAAAGGRLAATDSTTIQTSGKMNTILYDDLAVWNTALTPAHVAALYNGGAGADPRTAA